MLQQQRAFWCDISNDLRFHAHVFVLSVSRCATLWIHMAMRLSTTAGCPLHGGCCCPTWSQLPLLSWWVSLMMNQEHDEWYSNFQSFSTVITSPKFCEIWFTQQCHLKFKSSGMWRIFGWVGSSLSQQRSITSQKTRIFNPRKKNINYENCSS
jgi:hypothetical protein